MYCLILTRSTLSLVFSDTVVHIYGCWQLPPQLYKPVHAKLAFKHLNRPLHEALHPHRMSSRPDSFPSGKAVQNGDHELLSCCHPQLYGLGSMSFIVMIEHCVRLAVNFSVVMGSILSMGDV